MGMDIHRDHCEVAIAEAGRVRSAGRVPTRPKVLEAFAQSLDPNDEVVLEATIGAVAIAAIIRPHVRVVVVDPRRLKGMSPRKTGRRDASWSPTSASTFASTAKPFSAQCPSGKADVPSPSVRDRGRGRLGAIGGPPTSWK